MLVVTGSAVAVSAVPVSPASAAVAPPIVAASADERSALAAAEQRGERVEVLSARTEFSQTFATPRRTLVVEEHLRPQWVRSAEGAWVEVDPSLVQAADGSWSPVAATVAMSFSDGGDEPFASISAGGESVGLRWPGSLPEPVVDGNVATYPNVAPFVDLQVVADVDGFTHLVVIRSPKALAKVGEIALATELSGVSLRTVESGAVEAVDAAGAVVFSGPSPMMWDSREESGPAPEAKAAAAAGVAAEPAMAPVEVEVTAGGLVLTPDAEMLSDPETVYPVVVDPTWIKATGKRNNWSLLRKSFPSSAFYNPAVGSTSSSDSTRGIVRAGFVVEDRTYTDRSIFNMSTSAVKYKRINKATFSLTQAWSYYNCSSTTKPVTQLRSVGSFGSSTTWNNQPSWGSVLATSNKIRKYGYSCGPQRVEYSVTGAVRSAADSGKSSINLGLRAQSETTGNWTRFKNDAQLSIEYNTAPNAPTQLKVQDKACATGSARPYVTVNRPAFSARAGDPDSGQQSMTTRFYWWQSSSTRNDSDYVTGTSANPGTANSASIPSGKALVDRQVYKVQARTGDGIDWTWSSVCEFRAWLTPPNPPGGVASTAYPVYNPTNPGPGSGGVGVSGQFTISPPSAGLADVTGYAYTLDSGVSASAAPTVSKRADGSGLVTITPKRDGLNVLRVWSKDVAGLFSSVVEYRFQVRAGDGPAAQWVFDNPDARGEDDTGHGNTVSFAGNATVGTGRAGVGQALTLDGTGDGAATAGPLTRPHPDTGAPVVVRTDGTFTVAAWVKVNTTSGVTDHYSIVSADGSTVYSFLLSYAGPENRWRFSMPETDGGGPTLRRVFSDAVPVAGRWTHLAGTYNAATGQLRLYVNGVLQSESNTLTGGFHAAGPVQIGRRLWAGNHAGSELNGQVDDVRVYPYLVPAADLVAAAKPLPPVITFPDGDAAQVGGTLRVRFDAAGDTNVTSFKYSVGTDALNQTVTLGTAGGTATVTIPVPSAGELSIFAATVDRLNRASESASVLASVLGAPEVSGVVYDELTQQPVAGATVVLDQLGLEATTGADGTFRFQGLAAGTYTLAAHVGGQCGMAAATEVEIVGPVVVDLSLVPATDDFGYQCFDTPGTPFAPTSGGAITLTGNDAVTQVSLPFGFPFYGEQRTIAWIDTNGLVAFENPGGSSPGGEGTIPSPARPDALIAAYWADLVVDAQASVRTQTAGTAPLRTFTIEWRNVHLNGDTGARFSVQAVLRENGNVLLSYTGLETAAEQGQNAVVGIESPGGQIGVQYAYKQAVLATNLQILFAYPEEPNPIAAFTLSGTVVDTTSGQPAAGVDVLLDSTEESVTTAADGTFTFDELEWGTYTIEAKAGSHCGKAGHEYVELEASVDVQLNLLPAADAFGYTCAAGPREFLPTSTTLALSGDDALEQVALPFTFSFYGESYSQAWVDTNGILALAPPSHSWSRPMEIPSVHGSPSSVIYGLWSDWIVVPTISSVHTGIVGTAPNRQFVVEWRNVEKLGDASAHVSFQVVLYETTNRVAVAWDEIDDHPLERGLDAVVGVENADGTIALPYQQFDLAIASGQGVIFTPGEPALHQVSGHVTCEGNPVAGAEVLVAEQTATTDAEGGFALAGVPPGPQGLIASASSGPCAGAVSMPVSAARGEPVVVEVALTPVAQAVGYTLTRAATATQPADTVVPLPDEIVDDGYIQVTPPFPVKLYGQAYSTAWVDTNGYLAFADPGSSNSLPFSLPTDQWAPRPAVFPFWSDWVVDEHSSIRTGVSGVAPHRRWVVEWRGAYPYPNNFWLRVSFQVVFEETTGRIIMSYRDIDPIFVERGGAALVGVQNAAGTQAVEFSYLAPVLRNDRGLIFTPVS